MQTLDKLQMQIRKFVNKLILLCTSFIFCAFSIQCRSQELTLDDKKIIALMVDKMARPLPPPPPINSKDTIISDKIMDSLFNVKLEVAIYPIMGSNIEESGIKKAPEKFRILSKSVFPNKYIVNLKGVKSKKGHHIILADTLVSKGPCDFKEFDLLMNSSYIFYNKEKTNAIFEFGVSRSCLAGFSTIFCLEKKDGVWSIVESIPTTMW